MCAASIYDLDYIHLHREHPLQSKEIHSKDNYYVKGQEMCKMLVGEIVA